MGQDTNTTYPPSLALRALELARSKIGEREVGRNQGPIVEWSLKGLTKRPPGAWSHWGAYFMWQCLLRAAQTPLQEQEVKSLAAGSCTDSWRHLAASGWAHKTPITPAPGWLVFFAQEDKRLYHCGFVEKVEAEQLHTIEGNHGDRVAAATYALTHPTLYGFAEVRL